MTVAPHNRAPEQATPESTPAEHAALHRAVALAVRGAATAAPNPVVGCVVLDADGTTVGEGWHSYPGGPHAEVVAITDAGERARGATAVVTLEPCAHTGRTGPCTDALVAAGISRVLYAAEDPSSVAGGGAQVLRDAGVTVVAPGELPAELVEAAEQGNARWLTGARHGRPHVIWKYAATLDGRVAAADGTSQWITGREARDDVHRLRAECDTIMVGIGTVLADDPHLTARDPAGTLLAAQPLRVVVDTEGRTPAAAKVCDDAAPTWVATADEVGRGAEGRVDLAELLARLHRRGQQQVLVEGGPTLAGALVSRHLVDRVIGYLAPAVLGAGPAALGDAGITTLAQAWRLQIDDVRCLGADLRISARPSATGRS